MGDFREFIIDYLEYLDDDVYAAVERVVLRDTKNPLEVL